MRQSKRLTLEEFGARCHDSKGMMSRLVRGEVGLSRKFLSQVVEAFGVNREWLLEGKGEPYVTNETETETGLKEETMPYMSRGRDGGNPKDRNSEALKWLLKDEEQIVEKVAEVLHDSKVPWPRRIQRAEDLLAELRRRVGHKHPEPDRGN